MGLVAARDVIDWADAMIQTEAVPPDWVFDISLAANEPKEAIIARLSDVTDRIDVVLPSQKALERFARAFDSGELAPLDAAQKLVLWASSTRLSDDGRSEAFTVKFIAEDVEDGIYGSPADVVMTRLSSGWLR